MIEDIAMHRRLFRDVLGAHGFDVIEVEDGTDLWSAVADTRIDAALIDVYLPRISGIAVVGTLRERWDAASFPIIGISAMSDPGIRRNILLAGANAYFTKPVGVTVLARTFSSLLDRGIVS